MARPVFNPGHYTHASGFEYQQDVFETEVRERLLAVVNSFGVVSGLAFTDTSVPGKAAMQIGKGLAYDGTGRRIKLLANTEITGIVAADLNKVMVIENVTSGVNFEAHPDTGVLSATRNIDVPTLSVLATGAVVAAKHVRLGRLTFIDVDASPPKLTATTIAGRDTLSFPSSSPFVVVGPAGDAAADFAGNDATPFNEAQAQLLTNLSGGIIAIKPGSYTILPSNPIVTEGFDSIRFLGLGRGVGFLTNGPGETPHWKIRNNNEVLIEGTNWSNTIHSAIEVRDTARFTFRRNRFVGNGSGGYRGITFISGITWAKIEENEIAGDDNPQFTFLGNVQRGVSNMHFRSNHFISTNPSINGEVENLIFSENYLDNSADLKIGVSLSLGAPAITFPKRAVVSNNIFNGGDFISTVSCGATGVVIVGNSWRSERGSCVSLAAGADYCVIAGNSFHIFDTSFPSLSDAIVRTVADKGTIQGNTFNVLSGLYPGPAIELTAASSDNLVDGNIIFGFNPTGPPILDAGPDNWAVTGVNNTSNKLL